MYAWDIKAAGRNICFLSRGFGGTRKGANLQTCTVYRVLLLHSSPAFTGITFVIKVPGYGTHNIYFIFFQPLLLSYHLPILPDEEVLPEKKRSWRKQWRWNKGSGTSSGLWAPSLCAPELAPGRPSPRRKTSKSWFHSGSRSSAWCGRPWTSFGSPVDHTKNEPASAEPAIYEHEFINVVLSSVHHRTCLHLLDLLLLHFSKRK